MADTNQRVNEARAMSATYTDRPLTTTNTPQELITADANLKAHPPVTERFVTIQQSRRFQRNWSRPAHLRTIPPLYP
ncbi:hypothetical protein V4C53_44785 [Paraburkholderia azotifigens]|uniref:hypothetical protein n=1 Tax=Paraburkholderia azotifigens TaxID=2057004 RepID=UPI00317014D9